jgi:hypothetical protein
MHSAVRCRWTGGRPLRGVARLGLSLVALIVLGCCNAPTKPPPSIPPPEPTSPAEFIQGLAKAYEHRDIQAFETLFPQPEAGTPYLYFLSEALPNGQTNWDLAQELYIHHRMFEPEKVSPGESPVPDQLWLQAISIALTPVGSFAERPDLYRSPANPNGIDPERWQAVEGQYQADIVFDMTSGVDYRVRDDKLNFVVLDLRERPAGEPGKYFLYRWEDLGASGLEVRGADVATEGITWSGVKALYSK